MERGNNYFDAIRTLAAKNKWTFNWRKNCVPDVGHKAVAMSLHAGGILTGTKYSTLMIGAAARLLCYLSKSHLQTGMT